MSDKKLTDNKSSGHYDIFDWTDLQMGKTNHDNVFQDAIMQKFRNDVLVAMGKQPQPTPTPTPVPYDYPDPPFFIKIKAAVSLYSDDNGSKKIGEVKDVGVYTIVQCNEKTGFGKLKSGAGWVDLKDPNIYIRGGEETEMKFTDLKECLYTKPVMTGDPVRVIQSVVKPIDGVDGSFGPNTRDAVIKFQKANGLNPDGIVGAKTWEKIYSKCE